MFNRKLRFSPKCDVGMTRLPSPSPGITDGDVKSELWDLPVWISVLLWLVSYSLATSFTRPIFFGDTRAYTLSILNFTRGEFHPFWEDNAFWDFGHLLWRPIGWLTFVLLRPITSHIVGSDPRASIASCLFGLNWIAGLLSVLVLNLILRKVSPRTGWNNILTVGFLVSQALLNFSQTGASYVPGQLLLLLSIYVSILGVTKQNRIWVTSLIAGFAFAGAVCLWFLYIFATPSLALTPIMLVGNPTKSRLRIGLQTCIIAGLVTICAYALVIAHLNLQRWQDVLTWVLTSSHGVDNIKGLSRTAFGFARSFFNMGRDGILFKRFLLHDLYNPVSLFQLFRLSLAKFLLFYYVLICMLVALLRCGSRHFLVSFVICAVPVMGFAVFWQGGDIERYLPLFPLLFIGLSRGLVDDRARWFRSIVFVFVAFLGITNISALSRRRSEAKQKTTSQQLLAFKKVLKSGSEVILLDDELATLRHDTFPVTTQDDLLPTYILLTVGTSSVPVWRENFSNLVLSVWRNGGDIWVSKRLLDARPDSELAWVEGDDKRISWRDIHGFFSQLEVDASVFSPPGFTLLSASSRNRTFLQISTVR